MPCGERKEGNYNKSEFKILDVEQNQTQDSPFCAHKGWICQCCEMLTISSQK
jgi:hypothetical protein